MSLFFLTFYVQLTLVNLLNIRTISMCDHLSVTQQYVSIAPMSVTPELVFTISKPVKRGNGEIAIVFLSIQLQ